MGSILSLVRDRDLFGKPISINFKGSAKYKTLPGGLCSLVLFGFLFPFTVISIFNVLTYKNPLIGQVSVFFAVTVLNTPNITVDFHSTPSTMPELTLQRST